MAFDLEKITQKREAPIVLPELTEISINNGIKNNESIFSESKKGKSLSDWLAIGGFFGMTGAGLAWTMQQEAYASKAWKVVKLHNNVLAGADKPMFKDVCLGRMRKAPPSKKLLIAAAISVAAFATGLIINNLENKKANTA